jgi:tetratricopeptide (TPR) repeat protein
VVAVCLLASGCATARLDSARAQYFGRNPSAALADLPPPPSERDLSSLLYLLERATIQQTLSNYVDSAADFLRAAAAEERLKVGSVSQSSTSMLVNDMTKSFRGVPFEQTLLHALAANNYLALGRIDDASVEARNVIEHLSTDLDHFPDSAYARYMAGACLELAGDREGATIEYRKASSLLSNVAIASETGRFILPQATNAHHIAGKASSSMPAAPFATASVPHGWNNDLVCLLGIGAVGPAKGTDWHNSRWGTHPYAEIFVNGVLAGRSVPLDDTLQLHAATQARLAAAKATKTIVRTGMKFAIANAVSERNDGLGTLVWMLLIALETEDLRRWETLPRWLHAARVSCPNTITSVRVVFKRSDGTTVEEQMLPPSPARSSRLTVTFTRAL